jgi:hypothetical protein
MVELVIRDEQLASKLFDIARHEQRSVEEVLQTLIAEHYGSDESPFPGSSAELAQSALNADIHSEPRDTSSRSREILQTEYADYLKRRHHET